MEATASSSGGIFIAESTHRPEMLRAWRRFKANRLALIGLGAVIVLALSAILAPLIAPYDPVEDIFRGMRGVGPSPAHPMGFDHLGRDLFSRVVFGARVALTVGISATLVSVTIGVPVGAAAGYFGGWVDSVLSRATETLMAFPIIALLIVLASVLRPSLMTTVVVIGVTTWSRYARVVRADVMSLRYRDFVTAARATGASDTRILWRHITPNVLGPIIVLVSLSIGSVIILEASLSFLGLGIRPPTPSWGGILADGRAFILHFPHISIFPGIMIFLTVLAFNFVGDGLRDAVDPRRRE